MASRNVTESVDVCLSAVRMSRMPLPKRSELRKPALFLCFEGHAELRKALPGQVSACSLWFSYVFMMSQVYSGAPVGVLVRCRPLKEAVSKEIL